MIKSKEVKVYQDRLYCDECGEEMEFTGMALTSYPMQYPHVCPKCGKRHTTTELYPKIRYEVIEETSTKIEKTPSGPSAERTYRQQYDDSLI